MLSNSAPLVEISAITTDTVIPIPQSSPTPIISLRVTSQATTEIPTTFPMILAIK